MTTDYRNRSPKQLLADSRRADARAARLELDADTPPVGTSEAERARLRDAATAARAEADAARQEMERGLLEWDAFHEDQDRTRQAEEAARHAAIRRQVWGEEEA